MTEPDNSKQTASPEATKVLGEPEEQVKTASESEPDNFKQTASLEATKVLRELGEQVKTASEWHKLGKNLHGCSSKNIQSTLDTLRTKLVQPKSSLSKKYLLIHIRMYPQSEIQK